MITKEFLDKIKKGNKEYLQDNDKYQKVNILIPFNCFGANALARANVDDIKFTDETILIVTSEVQIQLVIKNK